MVVIVGAAQRRNGCKCVGLAHQLTGLTRWAELYLSRESGLRAIRCAGYKMPHVARPFRS